MMTSSNGNVFRVTGPLCGEFIGHRWIPLTKTSDAKLWCFLWSTPKQTVSKQSRCRGFKTPSRSLWLHCNVDLLGNLFRSGFGQKNTLCHTGTLRRKSRQGDSPGIHWRRWSLSSASLVNTKAYSLLFTLGNSRYINRVGCRYDTVQYQTVFHTVRQWLMQNINQSLILRDPISRPLGRCIL